MTARRQLIAIILATALSAPWLGGCWDRMEINDTALVLAMGISRTPTGEFRVVAEIALPSRLPRSTEGGGGGGPGGGATSAALVREATGKTVHAALGRLTIALGRTIDESHCNILMLGEDVLTDGSMAEVMDWMTRFYQIRREKIILVSDVDPADILFASPQLDPTQGLSIYKTVMAARWDCLPGYHSTVRDIMARQNTYGVHVALGRIGLINEPDGSKAVVFTGIAVLDGGRLLGSIPQDESRFVNTILNESRGSTLVLELQTPSLADMITRPTPGYHGGDDEGAEQAVPTSAAIALHATQARTRVKVRLENGVPVVGLSIQLNALVMEMGMPLDLSSPAVVEKLNGILSQYVADRVKATIAVTQSFPKGGDIFFFGEAIHDRYPAIWHQIKDDWDTYYRALKVDVTVNGSIVGTGRSLAPSVPHR